MLYFDKEFATDTRSGRNHKLQKQHITRQREYFAAHNQSFVLANGLFTGNAAAIIPQDVYREFESQTKEIMRAPTLTLMNDLMGMAKGLAVGKIEHIYRQASDSGVVVTDLEGSAPVELDKADYAYDSSIKVVHKTGFGRSWMEMEGQRSEGFDGLVDDQANSVRLMQETIASHFYDGVSVTFKGTTAAGIKNSAKTVAVDLDATGLNIDLTSSATTGEAFRAAFISMRDSLRITNNARGDVTFYVPQAVLSNMERYYSTTDIGFGTILESLRRLEGIADIKEDANLTGNECIGLIKMPEYIRPLVGMPVTTVPLVRQNPFENYNFVTWSNVGLEQKVDYDSRAGVLYARAIP